MKPTRSPLRAIRKLLPPAGTENCVTRLQGAPDARLLLIAPPVGAAEIKQNAVWCGATLLWFRKYLARCFQHTGLPRVMMVPTCFHLPRNPKRVRGIEAAEAIQVVQTLLKLQQFTGVLCIGGEAYRHMFGFGSKPSMAILAFRLTAGAGSNYRPVFVLPDLDLLTGVANNRRQYTFRDLNIARILEGQFDQATERVVQFMEGHTNGE